MKKLNSLLLTICIIGFNLISTSIFAQDTDPGLPIVTDPGSPAAPINDWIFPMMVLGVVFLFFYCKKQQKVVEIKNN